VLSKVSYNSKAESNIKRIKSSPLDIVIWLPKQTLSYLRPAEIK